MSPTIPTAAKAAERTTEEMLAELRQRLQEVSDLGYAGAVLGWDQATYMPSGGALARGRQKALLSRLGHERMTDPAMGRLLDGLERHSATSPGDSDTASLVRVTRRDYERAIRVPADFVSRRSAAGAAAYDTWTRARPANDFAAVVPHLEKAVELSREYASYFKPSASIADPLIARYDEGMTTASVRALFAELRAELVPLAQAICDQPPADDSCLRGPFEEAPQLAFSELAVKRFGYDFNRGRLDKTHHPFCTKFGHGDVRITTRVRANDLGECLFSCLHEAGHAMYEQGVAAELVGTPLGHGTSSGVHESQSRLWENLVGRSRGFWQHFYPQLQMTFPTQLGDVPLDRFYRAINKVQRSLIRTDADEVTYNLHVLMRFDLETDLLEGRLAVRDLADTWSARMRADIGVAPSDHRDGCLQDVHWFGGMVGGNFQGYTIGNILAAQFHAAALAAKPGIAGEIERGEFDTLRTWLTDNIYRHGAKFEPDVLVRRVCDGPMQVGPYIGYLRAKYGELYDLPPAGNGKGKRRPA